MNGLSRRGALGGALGTAALASQADAAKLGAAGWRARKKHRRVHGLDMAYVEVGEGAPIVFLHGNPTSSYLWRNIIPHVRHLGRCIAPDLIGMGDSQKLPDSGPGRYSFAEHQRYLHGLLDELELGGRVTLVLHDWGSALGLTWAQRNPGRIRAIVHMEAIIEPPGSPEPAVPPGSFFFRMRSAEGEHLILVENGFVERLVHDLGLYLTAEDAAEYRRPFLTPGESRRPTLDWPRQLPLGARPADLYAAVRDYSDWLVRKAAMPKLFVRCDPGALITRAETIDFLRQAKNQTEVTVWGPHFVQEVSPHAIGRALEAWMTRL